MAQFRNRHRIIDASGDPVEGISTLNPPPSLLKLVEKDPPADAQWKKWLNILYGYIGTLTEQGTQVFITPASVTAITSDGTTGDVTDIQTLLDGNIYQVEELNATPAFNIEFGFTGVSSIAGFVTMIRYDGIATHDVSFGLHNYTNASDADRTSPYTYDDKFLQIGHSDTLYSYRTVLIPADEAYINTDNEVTAFLYHETSGNASHVAYIDYIALIGKTT